MGWRFRRRRSRAYHRGVQAPRDADPTEAAAPPERRAPWWVAAFDAVWLPAERKAIVQHMRGLTWQPLAWILGAGFDLLALVFIWPDGSWRWVLGLRALGAPLQPAVILLARRAHGRERRVALAAWLYTVAIAVILALQSLAFGALESPWVLGLLGFTFAGSLVAEVRASRVAMTVGAWFGAWVATLALAARWDPSVAAQWATVRSPIYHLGSWAIIAAVAAGSVHFGRQIATLQRELRVARRLSGYRLQARIGAGGMNEVWLARDEHAKRDVALKILHRDPSPEEARRFQREAEALQSLDSEHTVRVYEVGASDDGVMFIAMENLQGQDLGRLVATAGPLPPARAVPLIRQACASLKQAHARGIIHRDVKPSNLFLTRRPTGADLLKVLDFGIARRIKADEPRLTHAGEAVGTPHFMAPEAFQGAEPAPAADVYGLGATLYFLLTGEAPFEGRSGAALYSAVSSEPVEAPSVRARTALPAGLDGVILRALARDLSARYASMDELDAALAAVDLSPAEHSRRATGLDEGTIRRAPVEAPTRPMKR